MCATTRLDWSASQVPVALVSRAQSLPHYPNSMPSDAKRRYSGRQLRTSVLNMEASMDRVKRTGGVRNA